MRTIATPELLNKLVDSCKCAIGSCIITEEAASLPATVMQLTSTIQAYYGFKEVFFGSTASHVAHFRQHIIQCHIARRQHHQREPHDLPTASAPEVRQLGRR